MQLYNIILLIITHNVNKKKKKNGYIFTHSGYMKCYRQLGTC